MEQELLRKDPNGNAISPSSLAVATSMLNSRLRSGGLSSTELWTQRDQVTGTKIQISDRDVIMKQIVNRKKIESPTQ